VDHDENLEEGELLLKAIKAFASGAENDDDEDDVDEKKFLCAGALVQRPPSPIHPNRTLCDAWLADALMDNGDGGPNLQIQGAVEVLDDLFCHFLAPLASANNGHSNRDDVFVVQCGRATSEYTCASYNAALSRGFRPMEDFNIAQEDYEEGSTISLWHDAIGDGLVFHLPLGIERYTNAAWYHRGTSQGDTALEILRHLGSLRTPYVFEPEKDHSPSMFEGTVDRSMVTLAEQVLPLSVVKGVNIHLEQIERDGLLEDELDSVDGVPSQHISLISRGKTVIEKGTEADSILSLVKPYVEDILLPRIRDFMNETDIRVSDVFLRTYGSLEDTIADETARCDLAAHYDVFNFATAVIALDDTACDGTQGLYTMLQGVNAENGSSHSALRRYFPLSTGDAVLHSWRVKHGVQVQPNQKSVSLVVWFTKEEEESSFLPPSPTWLAEGAKNGDDVAQFVLASAMESLIFYCDTDELSFNNIQTWSLQELHPHDLLINSATQGNADALTRLGTLCCDGGIADDHGKKINEMLLRLRPASAYGRIDSDPLELSDDLDDEDEIGYDESINWQILSRRLWFEAAMRGSVLAQTALGDEAFDPSSPCVGDEELLMALTLYSLAAHQGDASAKAAVSNIIR